MGKEMAELWVKGLRKLIGHSDEKSEKLAKQAMESGNLPGFNKNKDMSEAKRAEREHKKRTKSLLLQQDLFVMTTTTVFRNLEEERIWDIDQSVRERFNAKSLYELALREDIPWRQWNHWVREKIVTYLRENNRIANPQQYGGHQAPQQMMHQQSQYGHNMMQHQQSQYGQMHHQQQPSYNQLPQYGQPQHQQPQYIPQNVNVNIPQQPMNTNWNVQPQQMQNFQMTGGAQQGPPQKQETNQAGNGAGGAKGDGECVLM